MEKVRQIEISILQTVSYFDIFNFPLTPIEIYKNLYLFNENISFSDFLYILECSEIIKKEISCKDGFYFIKNKDEIVQKRKEKYVFAYEKYKKALKYIKKLLNFSCFKSIMICNTLALENSNEESDIDLFIITEKNRIWTARFISVVISKILNLRPKKYNQKDKICLSFYIDKENLNIEKVSKNNNIYFIYWISQLVPIYDEENTFEKFFKENSWIKKYINNTLSFNTGYKRKIKLTNKNLFFRNIFNFIFKDGIEAMLKNIQIKKMNIEIKNKLNINDDVFINNGIIKLHTNDRREKYKKEFDSRIKKYYEKYI